MSTLVCTLQGRTGNQAMQWLFAYAYAKKYGLVFQCDEWIGERIWNLPPYSRPGLRQLPRFNEVQLAEFARNIQHPHELRFDFEYRGYAQTQWCVDFYTKREAISCLRLKPEVEKACIDMLPHFSKRVPITCHLRRGDYFGYNYVVVKRSSYERALECFGLLAAPCYVSEETPWPRGDLPEELSFMPDFYRMMTTATLLRANSSFSWLAALLNPNALVLSPVIAGLEGGREHDCQFVSGNWPRFANLNFTEDLHVSP
jgi:hypothetical protein